MQKNVNAEEDDKEMEQEMPDKPSIADYAGSITDPVAARTITKRETFYFDSIAAKQGQYTNVVFFKSGRKWGIVVGK